MKKILSFICLLFTGLLFASEWEFSSSVGLQMTPKTKAVVVDENDSADKNHFAPINGINIPAPYGQFVVNYKIPLNFGESIVFQDANVTLSGELNWTPVTYENQFIIYFSPSPVLTLSFESVAGTGWSLFGTDGLAIYDKASDSYKALTPFRDWKYSFAGKAEFQFDFGFLFPGEWTHVVTKLSYTARYEACTAAARYEPWAAIGSETVNGFTYSATGILGYMLPFKLNLIGLAVNFKGHFDGGDFGDYDSNYDGDFTEISLALQAVMKLNEKNELNFGATLPSRRAFTSEVEDGKASVAKQTGGREWYFNGLSVVWKYNF